EASMQRSTPSSSRWPLFLLLFLLAAAVVGAACKSGGHVTSGTGTTQTGSGGAGGSTGVGFGGFRGTRPGQPPHLSVDPPPVPARPRDGPLTPPRPPAGGAPPHAAPPGRPRSDRPDLPAVQIGSPVVLTATGEYAGTGTLHGIFQGLEATATLTAKVQIKDV